MAREGQYPIKNIIPIEGSSEVQAASTIGVVITEESPKIVEHKKNLVAHILRADQTVDFVKLVSLLKGDDIVAFLSEQKEAGNESIFFDFLDFLKQDYFGENNPVPTDIITLIRKNDVLKGYIVLYLKERNHQVLSEQNMRQCEIISFHLFLLGMNQDFDLAQDIRVKKFSHTESFFSHYSLEIGKILGKLQFNVWARNKKILRQELDLYLDFYIELCETIIKLGVIHSVNLEERKIAFDLSSIIKGTTGVIFDELKKSLPQNTKIRTLEHTIGRSMVNFARGGVIIDGKTKEEIKKQVIAVKKEQKIGFDMMVSSQFGGDLTKEKIFSIVFLGEGTCTELIGLEKIEKIYGKLNDEEEQRKAELLDNLLTIYNAGLDTDIETSASAIDAFVTKDHLENEYQIETIYHIVCFDKSLDEIILCPLLHFLITKKEFPNALYEQFSIKIIEQIIKILTKSNGEKMPETHYLIDQTFLYLQSKNSSNFILGHSRIYLALAYYYIGLPDETSIILAQKAYLHFTNLGTAKGGDVTQMQRRERQFYALLGDRGLKNLGIPTVLSTEEKEKIGQKLYKDFADGYETRSIDTIRTEVLGLISTLNTSDDVYSAKEINELISQKIAEKLFDNLCMISIIGECKNCIHQGDSGEILSCSDDKTQCKSRKMKKGYQAEYIDISNGLSIQFIYPVVSTHIFERMFVQKREMIKGHFENLIASNTKNETLTRLAFSYKNTDLKNDHQLSQDLEGKQRTIVALEILDYERIKSGGMEKWYELLRQLNIFFKTQDGFELYHNDGGALNIVISPEKIDELRFLSEGNDHVFHNMLIVKVNAILNNFYTIYAGHFGYIFGIAIDKTDGHVMGANIALEMAKNQSSPHILREMDEKRKRQEGVYECILTSALSQNEGQYSVVSMGQPIVYPKNPGRKKVEILSRISNNKPGVRVENEYYQAGEEPLIQPGSFINIAKNSVKYGLAQITQKTLNRIIGHMGVNPMLEVSINFDQQDWNHNGVMSKLREMKEMGIDMSHITIEILENVLLDKWERRDEYGKVIEGASGEDKKQIEELRALGCKLAIDDYGSHGGSGEKVRKILPDSIKIDRSMIVGLRSKDKDIQKACLGFIKGTIILACEIGAEVIAEHVETQEIFDILLDLGVDGFQGYLFSKPNQIEDIQWEAIYKMTTSN